MLDKVLPKFTELNELCSLNTGGKILFATDDFFAVAENMIADSEPIFIPEKYTEYGKWMDGWETRRKRISGHDWCIVKLATKSIIHGVEVDTAFFTGNYTPKYSIQAARLTPEEEALIPKRCSVMGTACTNDELLQVSKINSDMWHAIVPKTSLRPGYEDTRLNYQKILSDEEWTHIRVNMFPDGGIARLRVFGLAKPDLTVFGDKLLDLASMMNGGSCQGYSNAHYGHPRNMIKPGRGANMADGWETARRLDRPEVIQATHDGSLVFPGEEWAVFKLGNIGRVSGICVDTHHFKGNFPDSVKVEGAFMTRDWSNDDTEPEWITLVSPSKLSAHSLHWHSCDSEHTYSHIRVTMVPDGGISRIKVMGTMDIRSILVNM